MQSGGARGQRMNGAFLAQAASLAGLSAGWRLAVFTAGGAMAGLAVLTLHVSRATSYLSDVPETCINCHAMDHAYASWSRSSHATAATCTDCHLPHANPIAKLAYKARDGLWHSYVFTFRLEPQVIRLAPGAGPVVQENCLRCHHDQLQMVRLAGVRERRCWDCHRVPHGPISSLSAAPDAIRPGLPPAGPRWFRRPQEGDAP